ncbi:hypothetical protein CROQUDRAFT_720866 [Cronartium quercuum f. sp. fusiforme G11]|uniref:WD40 repeat-like protein n=1 Tax=Cronartium quercuum f. sp. fusiforme G11 TaxID=708437 RepID=A0A9P6NT22_9BASI|nr:hypothetical protein CROQUDRAFT_720866 [Cronartium quercuum f. sp. fusiforme G11]
MNLELQNPFAQDFPDTVETSLDSLAVVTRFNPSGLFAGQYLAVGRLDGCVTVLDFETKRTIKFLLGHVKPITSLWWSKKSRYLLSSSRDWNVIIWDLQTGERRNTIRFDAPVTSAQFHPHNSKVVVVTLQSQKEAIFVDLRSHGGRWELDCRPDQSLPGSAQTAEAGNIPQATDQSQDHTTVGRHAARRKRQAATVVRFNPSGDLIYVGTSQGSLHVFDACTKMLLKTEQIAHNNAIKSMEFDTRGTSLVLNSSDRVIRVYSLRPTPDEVVPNLDLDHRFQDMVARTPWQGCKFGSEYVVGGAGHRDSHQIFIWDRNSGGLTKILEGPKDPLEDFDWHPNRPILASVSNLGLIHVWVTSVTENWSSYAPGFDELDENVEYREREDEFDYEDELDVERRRKDEQDRFIDIFTVARPLSPHSMSARKERLTENGLSTEGLTHQDFLGFEPDDDTNDNFFIPIDYDLDTGEGEQEEGEQAVVEDAMLVDD